jgi:hypothetical protein
VGSKHLIRRRYGSELAHDTQHYLCLFCQHWGLGLGFGFSIVWTIAFSYVASIDSHRILNLLSLPRGLGDYLIG